MTPHLRRAGLLIEQRRWERAEAELRQALIQDSQNAEAHRLLAWCFLGREKFPSAEDEARMAIHLAPDDSSAHLTLGWVLFQRRRYDEAGAAAQESIRIEAHQSAAFALLAKVRFQREDWKGALQAARQGLECDPDDNDCTNLQAMALVQLGQRAEAGRTLGTALERDPEDPYTHANQGWAHLHAGERKKALEHFREALRLDPTQEWARRGIVEAMKAKNFIYRWLLAYFLFMSRMSSRARWGLVIGSYLGANLVEGWARRAPEMSPYLTPILILYGAFALLTWLGSPIANLLLLVDRFGRLTLSRDERWGAVCVAGALCGAVALLLGGWWISHGALIYSAIYTGLLALPLSAIFSCETGWPRLSMIAVTACLACLALLPAVLVAGVSLDIIGVQAALAALKGARNWFIYGLIGSQFLAMRLSQVRPTR